MLIILPLVRVVDTLQRALPSEFSPLRRDSRVEDSQGLQGMRAKERVVWPLKC